MKQVKDIRYHATSEKLILIHCKSVVANVGGNKTGEIENTEKHISRTKYHPYSFKWPQT
jgi:hypothetical protein